MATRTLKRDKVPATVEHPMAQIAAGGLTQITKQPVRTVGTDATMLATTLVAAMFAHVTTAANFWHGIAWRIIDAPTDARVAIITQIDNRLDSMRAENRKAHDVDGATSDGRKWTRANVDSYVVDVSRMRTIARAFNAGASVQGLAEHYSVNDPRNIGYQRVYTYCAGLLKTAAAGKGRPVKSLKSTLADLIAKYREHEAAGKLSDDDKVNLPRLVTFAENLQG